MLVLDPLWLLLGLLAIPILVFHARRPRRQVVPSLAIWREIASQSRPARAWGWPKPSLPLFLQLLALGALTLAAANLRLVDPEAPDHVVFVFDDSRGSRAALADARADLAQRLEALDEAGGALVSLVSVSADARILAARHADLDHLLKIVPTLAATDAQPDWPGAALWVETIINGNERTQVHVLSATPSQLELEDGPGDIDRSALVLPAPHPAPAVTVERLDYSAGGGTWELVGAVTASDAETMPGRVSISFAPYGEEDFLDWGRVALQEGEAVDGAYRARFAAPLALPGSGRLAVSAGDGAGVAGTTFHAVVEEPGERGRVLIVGEEAPELVRALRAAGDFAIERAEALPSESGQYDLVVVNGPRLTAATGTNTLFLGASAIDANQAPGETVEAEVSGWNVDHPLARGVAWSQLGAVRHDNGSLPPGLVPIVQIDGSPVVGARTTPFGRDVFALLELGETGWTQDAAFPAFIANMLDWQGLLPADMCVAGLACTLDRHTRTAVISGPDGAVVYDGRRLAARGDRLPEAEFVPVLAGFYRAEGEAGSTYIAVNAPRLAAPTAQEQGWEPWPFEAPLVLRNWLLALAAAALLAEFGVFLYRQRGAWPAVVGDNRAAAAARLLTLVVVGNAAFATALPALVPVAERVGVLGASAAARTFAQDVPVVSAQMLAHGGLSAAVEWAEASVAGPARLAVAAEGGDAGSKLGGLVATGRVGALDVLPVAAPADASIYALDAPKRVAVGETYRAQALVYAPAPGEARIVTLRNGEPVFDQTLGLRPGLNRAEALLTAGEEGHELVSFVLEAASDAVIENNVDAVAVEVTGGVPILVVARDGAQGEAFAELLAVQGLRPQVVAPNAAPRALSGWLAYEAVVLLDLPARSLRVDQLEQVQAAVGTHGRGLILLGDANAFGPGGYYGTPLEELSPLSSRVPHDRPQTAMLFVVDRSGSMDAEVGPLIRLDIVKEATLRAIDQLAPEDLVGVIGFDEFAQTILPMQQRGEADFGAEIRSVVPGGGTALYPALEEAIGVLEATEANLKHIIVLTDGLVEPVDFSSLLSRATAADVTISTVAAGSSAVTNRLQRIAEEGGGAYYATTDFRSLPSILMQDIMTLDDPLVEDAAVSVIVPDQAASPLGGQSAIPTLERHVRTTAKPEADVLLTLDADEDEERPLWAQWRYGSGEAVAFAANPAASSLQAWSGQSDYPRFWSQLVRSVLPEVAGPGLHLDVTLREGGADLRAHLLGPERQPIAGALVTAAIDGGTGLPLFEVRPGQYAGRLDDLALGASVIEASAGAVSDETIINRAYGEAYRYGFADPRVLEQLALASGGTVLTSLTDLPPIPSHWVWRSAVWPWILAALALFLLELFVLRGRRQ